MKKTLAILFAGLAFSTSAYANPSQTGATGLLTVPSAETLDTGNIAVGLWANYSQNPTQDAFIIPVTITLGLGSFIEVYGTYPNLLFNSEEEFSGRSSVDIGGKLRIWGKRNSPFKLAIDVFAQRSLSDRQIENADGKTMLPDEGVIDVGTRLIASVRLGEKLAFHGYGGYRFTGDSKTFDENGDEAKVKHDNQILYGAGVEYNLLPRLKVTTEISGETARDKGEDGKLEALLGIQYYLTPHLTLNLGGGAGIIGRTDLRVIAGLSTSQGIGTYIKAVPRVGGASEVQQKKQEPVKPVKIVPISRFMTSAATVNPAASKLEVAQEGDREEVVIRPYGQVPISSSQDSGSKVARATFPPVPEERKDVKKVAADADEGDGTTQLYGIDLKDERVQIASTKIPTPSEVMKVYRRFRFPDISFDYNQWEISADGKKFLAEIADVIRTDKNWAYLRVDGHTDDIGSTTYNKDLSLSRAISVANYLVTKEGVSPDRIFVKGMGKTKPIAENQTPEGKRLNRRCEILFLVPKAGQ